MQLSHVRCSDHAIYLSCVPVYHAIYLSCVTVYHAIFLEHLTYKDLCEKMAALLSVHACQLKETYVQGPSGVLSHTLCTTSVSHCVSTRFDDVL